MFPLFCLFPFAISYWSRYWYCENPFANYV